MRFFQNNHSPFFNIFKKRYLFIIFVDILIFYLINYSFSINEKGQQFLENYFVVIGSTMWIFLSYLSNRYHEFFKKVCFENLINSFLRIGLNFIAINIFFISLILLFETNSNLFIYSDSLFVICFIMLTIEICAKFILIKYENKNKFLFIGDYDRFELLNSKLFYLSEEKIDFLEYKNVKEIYERLKNYEILIFDDLSKLNDSYINNLVDLKEKGKIIMDVYEWCETVLKIMPSFLFKRETLTKKFRIKKNYLRVKRCGDVLFSLVMFILLLPLMLIIALLIVLEDGFPIIYTQTRVGNFGKEFRIFKFRSMIRNSEKDGVKWSSRNDNRITKIGKIIRLTRLDEIPQLFCVIKGDMSLIGPRPERPEFEVLLEKEIPFYKLRHLIKPGLSGWAQVNYPYGASIKDSNNKLSYDLYYLNHRSLILDFLIFFKTIKIVLKIEKSLPIKVN